MTQDKVLNKTFKYLWLSSFWLPLKILNLIFDIIFWLLTCQNFLFNRLFCESKLGKCTLSTPSLLSGWLPYFGVGKNIHFSRHCKDSHEFQHCGPKNLRRQEFALYLFLIKGKWKGWLWVIIATFFFLRFG